MTWSTVFDYGNTAVKTAGTTIPIFSPASPGLAVGDVLVVTVSSDNVQTADGPSTLHSSVIGTRSGTFAKAIEYTNGEGAAGEGVTVSVWYKRITSAVGGGLDEIEVTLASNVVAKLASCYVFHTTASQVNVAAVVSRADDADPQVLTISGLANREYLFFRATAGERDSFTYVPSANYTDIGVNTTGVSAGASTTDISHGQEYRIFTGTGDSTNPNTAVANNASVYIAFIDGATNKTLTADTGTFALSTTTTNFQRGRIMPAAAGAFALTGVAAALRKGLRLPVTTGTFTLTGNDADIDEGYILVATPQTFTVTAPPVGFLVNRILAANTGTFTLTGNNANIRRQYIMPAAKGAFGLTGGSAQFTTGESGRGAAATLVALQNYNTRKFNEAQRKTGTSIPLTPPQKQAQKSVSKVEEAVQLAQKLKRQQLLREILDIEDEILELGDLEQMLPPPEPPKGVLDLVAPLVLPQQPLYTEPVIDPDDEEAVMMLLLNTV